MPSVTILGGSSPINFTVEDKSEAIRIISSRLLTAATRSSVEKILNGWLAGSMSKALNVKIGSEKMTISYHD